MSFDRNRGPAGTLINYTVAGLEQGGKYSLSFEGVSVSGSEDEGDRAESGSFEMPDYGESDRRIDPNFQATSHEKTPAATGTPEPLYYEGTAAPVDDDNENKNDNENTNETNRNDEAKEPEDNGSRERDEPKVDRKNAGSERHRLEAADRDPALVRAADAPAAEASTPSESAASSRTSSGAVERAESLGQFNTTQTTSSFAEKSPVVPWVTAGELAIQPDTEAPQLPTTPRTPDDLWLAAAVAVALAAALLGVRRLRRTPPPTAPVVVALPSNEPPKVKLSVVSDLPEDSKAA